MYRISRGPAIQQFVSAVGRMTPAAATKPRHFHAPAQFDWRDPLGATNMFTEDELAISETAESYCQERMLPRVLGLL